MIPGDLLSAFPHRQFHTLPGLLDSWAALPNSYPNALRAMQGGSLYHFYDGLWYDPAERWTHDLPCERRTRYRLSQPDTVKDSFNSDILADCFCPVSEWYIYSDCVLATFQPADIPLPAVDGAGYASAPPGGQQMYPGVVVQPSTSQPPVPLTDLNVQRNLEQVCVWL